MTSWHTFFKGSPTFIDLTSFVQQSTQGTLLPTKKTDFGVSITHCILVQKYKNALQSK